MKIGLTGSIACGKSTVSTYLRESGCDIVDADALSRALTAPGGRALPAIREAFGSSVFDGAVLDRRKLGALVFSDAAKRDQLNALLHPLILSEIDEQMNHLDGPGRIVVGDVPLLFECGIQSWFNCIWVVSVPRRIQIERLTARDSLTPLEAGRRIDAQLPLEDKIRQADAVIDNSGSVQETIRQVDALLTTIRRLV